jgi:hypothetical protein
MGYSSVGPQNLKAPSGGLADFVFGIRILFVLATLASWRFKISFGFGLSLPTIRAPYPSAAPRRPYTAQQDAARLVFARLLKKVQVQGGARRAE